MKIAVNSRIYAYARTGIQRYIEDTYRVLMSIHPEAEFVFFQTSKRKVLGRTRTIPAFLGLVGVTLFDMLLVVFLIRDERPDVYHAPSHVLPLVRVRGVKYVLTVHDCAPFTVPAAYSLLYRTYFKVTLALSVRMADVICAVSESTKNDIVRLFGTDPEKITVTYCGFESLSAPEVRPSDDLPDEFFLAVVTHQKRKNVAGAIAAFSAVVRTNHDARNLGFVCVGSLTGAETDKIREQCERLGILDRCRFLGFVDDGQLAWLYRHARATVYPSLYEGFGIPPLESMSLGTIALVSDNSSLPEVVPFPELRFDSGSEESIAGRMAYVLGLSQPERDRYRDLVTRHARTFTWSKGAAALWHAMTR